MTRIVIERNDLPKILHNLPGVVASRTEEAIKGARGAAQKGVDESGAPSSDTGTLREGMAVQTAAGSDYDSVKAAALQAWTGNSSRFDKSGKLHTPERFEDLCGELQPLPSPANSWEFVVTLTVLMMYGSWWETGDAWDFQTGAKRPASPWFEPSVKPWAASELEHHYDGVIEECLR